MNNRRYFWHTSVLLDISWYNRGLSLLLSLALSLPLLVLISQFDTFKKILCTEPWEIEVEIEPLEPTIASCFYLFSCLHRAWHHAIACNNRGRDRDRDRTRDRGRDRSDRKTRVYLLESSFKWFCAGLSEQKSKENDFFKVLDCLMWFLLYLVCEKINFSKQFILNKLQY